MARRLTASEIREKQVTRVQAAVPDFRKGVERVVDSPTKKAAMNLDKAKRNYAMAIDSGKTKERLEAVSVEEWRSKTLAKADRISTGIAEAGERIENFHGQRMDHQATIDRELMKMGTSTPSEMDQRALKQIQMMRGNWYKRGK